jgi:hypothetical protein
LNRDLLYRGLLHKGGEAGFRGVEIKVILADRNKNKKESMAE